MNYLQQFIIFKLKVADALNEGYDTTKAFKNELEWLPESAGAELSDRYTNKGNFTQKSISEITY